MILYLCDMCGTEIHEKDIKTKSPMLCFQCQEKKEEHFFCDVCHKKFPLDMVRKQDAFVTEENNMTLFVCKKCKIKYKRRNNNKKEIQHLLMIFIATLLVPIIIYSFLLIKDTWSGKKQQRNTLEKRQIARLFEEIRALREEIHEVPKNIEKKIPKKLEAPPKKSSSVIFHQMIKLISQKALKQVTKHLKHGTYIEKVEAIRFIVLRRERQAIPLLIEHLGDKDPIIRSLIIQALGKLGAKESVTKIYSYLRDPDKIVRRCASQTLYFLTNERFIFFEDVPEKKWERLNKMKKKFQK